jgi:RNA polymerase sigma-70 factor, ECF subfamily
MDSVVGAHIVTITFEEFYVAEFHDALALAMALVPNRAEAEELVQDAFADAHRRWARLSRYDKPGAWIRRAVLNRSVSHKRRWLTRQRAVMDIVTTSHVTPIDTDLWAAVRRLPTRQAQLVALVYVDGMQIADAAAVLGLAPTTASTHLSRARHRLQTDLADWKEST